MRKQLKILLKMNRTTQKLVRRNSQSDSTNVWSSTLRKKNSEKTMLGTKT